MERKLLIAIGNSGLDNTVIKYIIKIFQRQTDIALHLLTVIPLADIPASHRLLADLDSLVAARPAAQKKKVEAEHHHANLTRKLKEAGFAEEQVNSDISFTPENVSGVILRKAQTGLFDAIVLAKRDLSRLQKMIMGSISAELWSKNHSIPLWIINGVPASRNFLVPVDCSPHTLNAADHLGFIMREDRDANITFFHSSSLLAEEIITPKEAFYEKWGREWCDEHLKGDENGHYHCHAPFQILLDNGIPAEHIRCENHKSGVEPAQMIVKEVKKHAYSTIVMGRRPNKEKNIFKGVTDRVLANVNDVALWIVD